MTSQPSTIRDINATSDKPNNLTRRDFPAPTTWAELLQLIERGYDENTGTGVVLGGQFQTKAIRRQR